MTFTDTESLKYEVYEEMGVKIFYKLNYFDEQERGRSYKGDRGVWFEVTLRISDQIISIQNKIKEEFKK